MDSQISAAIGRATTIERYATTKPRERAVALSLGAQRANPSGGLDCRHLRPDAGALGDADPDPLVRIEPPRVDRVPAADVLVGDLEDPRPARVLLDELLGDGGDQRPEAVLREDPLRGRRLREADERVRRVAVLAVLDDGDRRLDEQRLPWDDVLQLGEPRLVLVRDEDVTAPGDEGVRRVAAGRVERDDVLEQLLDEVAGLPVRLTEAPLGAVRGISSIAAPDESGFGSRPDAGFSRSFQFLIFLGLPSRTAKTTIEFVAIPLNDCLSQFGSTSPAFSRSSMSSPVESWTMSAFSPAATARASSPEAP